MGSTLSFVESILLYGSSRGFSRFFTPNFPRSFKIYFFYFYFIDDSIAKCRVEFVDDRHVHASIFRHIYRRENCRRRLRARDFRSASDTYLNDILLGRAQPFRKWPAFWYLKQVTSFFFFESLGVYSADVLGRC